MTDLSRFTPGEVLAIDDRWGDMVFAKAVVFCGVDRGLAVVAEADVNAPFYTDPHDGSRPHLHRATWTPRRVRRSTIRGTWAEEEARRAAERNAEVARRAAEADEEEAAYRAARRLSDAIEALVAAEVGVGGAYPHQRGVHVFNRALLERLADIVEGAL